MSTRSSRGRPGRRRRRAALIDRLVALGQSMSTETALFHDRAAASRALGITDTKTLSILLQEAPMTAGRIAQRLSLTTGAVLVERLARRNLVSRKRDADDRCKVIVVPNTPEISQRGDSYQSIGAAFAALLQTYSDEQLEFLTRYHEASIDLIKREIRRLELRSDFEAAFSLIPGRHRANLHSTYGETGGRKVERDALTPDLCGGWIQWAKKLGIGLDRNETCER